MKENLVSYGFKLSEILHAQVLAIDFIIDSGNHDFYISEISYGFCHNLYSKCPGFWTRDMVWHEESFHSENWIIENILSSIEKQKKKL